MDDRNPLYLNTLPLHYPTLRAAMRRMRPAFAVWEEIFHDYLETGGKLGGKSVVLRIVPPREHLTNSRDPLRVQAVIESASDNSILRIYRDGPVDSSQKATEDWLGTLLPEFATAIFQAGMPLTLRSDDVAAVFGILRRPLPGLEPLGFEEDLLPFNGITLDTLGSVFPEDFVQVTPSAEWVVAHGLGRIPQVQVITDNEVTLTDVAHDNPGQFRVFFAAPATGMVIVR